MTINERIKLLRKEKKLNQKQFASLLGVTQSGASYMEQPGNNVSDSIIKAICTVCNANEEWLRNGVEPMHVEAETFSLDEFVKQLGATELEMQIVKTYFDLDPDTRAMLVDHFRNGLLASSPAAPASPAEMTVEEAEELYKKNILSSAHNTGFTASSTTSGAEKEAKNA